MPIEDRIFFIVGRGRSGTTLVSRILNAHPEIAVAPEALFVMNLERRYRTVSWDDAMIRRFSADLWREDRLRRWQLDPESLQRDLLTSGGSRGFARLCGEVYAANARALGRNKVRLLGDKNPHYSLFVDRLATLFPRARFLHVVRDYRDNIGSYMSVPFDLSSITALASRWKGYNRKILAASISCRDRYFRVRFEDLLDEPEAQLDDICRFLGVSFHPEMLDFRGGGAVSGLDWHKKLSTPLDPGQIGKWRDRIPRHKLRQVEAVCAPLGRRFGYHPTCQSSPVDRILATPGAALGALLTFLERALFRTPLLFRTRVIRTYRSLTGNTIP